MCKLNDRTGRAKATRRFQVVSIYDVLRLLFSYSKSTIFQLRIFKFIIILICVFIFELQNSILLTELFFLHDCMKPKFKLLAHKYFVKMIFSILNFNLVLFIVFNLNYIFMFIIFFLFVLLDFIYYISFVFHLKFNQVSLLFIMLI
jgi:hypothetical protein